MTESINHNDPNYRINLLTKLILTGEEEKYLASFKLHENIAQLMAAVLLHIGLAKMNMIGDGEKYLLEAENIIKEAMKTSKSLAADLAPLVVSSTSLSSYIKQMTYLVNEQKDIKCVLDFEDETINKFPMYIKNIIFHIIQHEVISLIKNPIVYMVTITIKMEGEKIRFIIQKKCKNFQEEKNSYLDLCEKIHAFGGTFSVSNDQHKQSQLLEITI